MAVIYGQKRFRRLILYRSQFNTDDLIFGVFLKLCSVKSKIAWICLMILAAGHQDLLLLSGGRREVLYHGRLPLMADWQRILFGWLPLASGYYVWGHHHLVDKAFIRLVGDSSKDRWMALAAWPATPYRFIASLFYVLFTDMGA